jgi:hypothetical protein
MMMDCIFCKGKLAPKGKCLVCERCKTVAFNKGYDEKELKIEVNDCIEAIQKVIESNSGQLHEIEQCFMSGKGLSENENRIRKYCKKYLECRMTLECYMNTGIPTKNFDFKQQLYVLLECGLEFEKMFGEECKILEI